MQSLYSSEAPEAIKFMSPTKSPRRGILSGLHSPSHGTREREKVCVKYMGMVGGEWPTPQVRVGGGSVGSSSVIMYYYCYFTRNYRYC